MTSMTATGLNHRVGRTVRHLWCSLTGTRVAQAISEAAPETDRARLEREALGYRRAYEAVIPALVEAVLEMRRLNDVIDALDREQSALKGSVAARTAELAEARLEISRLSSALGQTSGESANPDAR